MPAYDKDIVLSIGYDADDAEYEADRLGSKLEKSLNRHHYSKQFTKDTKDIVADLKSIQAEAQDLGKQMREVGTIKAPTDEYKGLQKQLESADASAENLRSMLQTMIDQGGDPREMDWLRNVDLKDAEDAIKNIKERMAELEDQGKAFRLIPNDDSQEYQDLIAKARDLRAEIQGYQEEARKAKLAENAKRAKEAFIKLGQAIKNANKHLLQMAGSAISKGIKKLASNIRGLHKNQASANDIFKKGLRVLLRYGIGVRSLYFLFRKIRKFLGEGITNLADSYAPFGETMERFKTALEGLKNNIGAAFEPVLQTVLPILVTLINVLNTVISKIGQFFAALKGQTTYLKGAAKAQKNYGASMGGSAKKAEELKRQLAGFDDVQILKNPDDSSGGGGGGSSSGSDFENVFEKANVDPEIINFVKNLKETFQQQDWEGLGKIIAGGINSAFNIAGDFLNSDVLHERLNTIVTAIVETANSIVTNIDWATVGSTISSGINLIFETLHNLISGFDWVALGTGFATGLNEAISSINWPTIGQFFADRLNILIDTLHGFLFGDGENGGFDWAGAARQFTNGLISFITSIHWAEAGQNFSRLLTGALEFLITAIKEFDWQGLGNNIYNFLSNIDWLGIISGLAELLGSVIAGLGGLIGGILEPIWQNIVDWFNGKTEEWKEQGVDIVGGILLGILEAVGNIFIWIYDNIFKPIYDGICKAFGIESPAKEMNEPGKMIIEGLKKGITDAMKKIGDWIKEKILAPVQEAFENAVLTVKVGLEKAAQWSKDAWDALKKGGQSVISTVKAAVQKATTWVADAWTAATMKTQEVIRTVKSALEKVGSWASDVWEAVTMKTQEITRKVKSALEKAGGWASDVWEAITMKASSITRTVISAVKKADTWISDAWAAAKLSATTIYRGLVESVSKAGGAWSDAAWEAAKMVAGTVRRTLEITAKLIGSAWDAIKRLVTGRAEGGVYVNGHWQNLPQFARGGVIPKYAGGTTNAHGTMFVAGEHGPEIVGNINGRTEILNKSQIASAIYSAVLNAMGTAVNSFARFISARLSDMATILAANTMILQNSLNNVQMPEIANRLNDISSVITKLSDITVHSMVPAVANGAVVPYSINTQLGGMSTDIKELLNEVRAMPLFTKEELSDIIDDIVRRRLNIEFYLGDEQLARHANAGNIKLDRRYNR